ncbi:hypothetical protein P0082_00480 [Candidatus Haliotispira prima]|uniref:Uncharacterized protein n=1 Tax=Candidatus Haliotispira prima TaxID=3034016 RepID=A0ABY8MH71_9SPIO|nr:hypothetical protein P0082_00480 [Candidatus Haliotispira prima]
MLFTLLPVTFLLALAVSFVVIKIFNAPTGRILKRIIQDKIAEAWQKYLKFAAYVTGLSGGVDIHKLELYIRGDEALDLNWELWLLEVYRIVIQTMQSLAWMYLTVFLLALIAFAIVRGAELKYAKSEKKREERDENLSEGT